MSDSTRFSDAGSDRSPSPIVFDPAGSLADDLQPAGTVVLLLAGARHAGWAADAAVALASAWAGSGRIVLADLHLDNPSLHERLDVPNLEGMVDVFLYGASISRSARPVRGRGFYLISAGTYEPDAEAIYRHPRWPKLVAGFREANATLLLFAPAESADLEAVSRWADGVVLLGADLPADALRPLAQRGVPVSASLVPPGATPPREDVDATLEAPAAAARRPAEDPDLALPPAPPRPEHRGGTRSWLIALVVLLAVGGLALAGYWAARNRPGWFGAAAGAGEPAAAAAAPAPPAPTRTGEALPFSVQVKAFSSFPAARQELLAQMGSFDSIPFFVSPEEVQGVLYFKIMGGLAPDTGRANALHGRLVAAGAIDEEDAAGGWSLIRPTPFTFDLGEYPSAAEAMARADSLLLLEVPTYTVAMPYSDGSRRWQLYGGAYGDSASAEAMRLRLVAAALQPRLVLRIGAPAGGEAAVP